MGRAKAASADALVFAIAVSCRCYRDESNFPR